MAQDKNYVSFWFWFFAKAICVLPCIGIGFSLIFAFIGENESRKNYFRAVIVWQILIWGTILALYGLGLAAVIWKALEEQFPHLTK